LLKASFRQEQMKPDWTLVANGTRARLLQQAAGAPMVILESFIHPVRPAEGFAPGASLFGGLDTSPAEARQHIEFARELAHLLEQEAHLDHFARLTVFASDPFLDELAAEFGPATRCRIIAMLEADLTRCTLSELEDRIARDVAEPH
jgi:hypothetical protein